MSRRKLAADFDLWAQERIAAGDELEPVELEVDVEYDRESRGETFPCSGCGRFAFDVPRSCYWCREGREG